jgi:uncharacterized membrane protein YheB (UPF0754 family)
MEDDETIDYFELLLSDLEDEATPIKEKFDRRAAQDAVDNAFSAVEHTKLLDLLEKKNFIDRRDRDELRDNVLTTVNQMLRISVEKYFTKNPDSAVAKGILEGIALFAKEHDTQYRWYLTRNWKFRRG